MATFSGKVSRKKVASGSKSQHQALVLATAGGEYILRRLGGPTYGDPEMEPLVGQRIKVSGKTEGNWLLFSSWQLTPT